MTECFFSFKYENHKLIFLDQTKLPLEEVYIETDSYERLAEAIERLEVRGAPAIGIVAAYAISLGMENVKNNYEEEFNKIFNRLSITRPTAVNLFWALNRMKNKFLSIQENYYQVLLNEAIDIHNDDINKCELMARNGLQIFTKKSVVLTHCNSGKLATGGEGTALGLIKHAFKNDLISYVYADETRPLLQGLRLTAFELEKERIPFTVLADSMAAILIRDKKIDMVITGADRIAKNGDSANKIGTYNLAVLCKYHNIPFYIVAPTSTIDYNIENGKQIVIEERSKSEIISLHNIKVGSDSFNVFNPSFDVTPSELISGIITENGCCKFPYNFEEK